METLCAREWAVEQFGSVEVGDPRRRDRVVDFAACVAQNPAASIPRQCGNWSDTKAAYNLMKRKEVTFQSLTLPHLRLTRLAAAQCSVVLHVSDTTTLSFDHPATQGLGPVGHSDDRSIGMLLHSTLAVDVSGGSQGAKVLGLSHGQLWTRLPGQKLEPESSKWPAAIEALGAMQRPASCHWIHVGDCESDCWDAIQACRERGMGFVIRACQNRMAVAGHGDEQSPQLLFEQMRRQPVLGSCTLLVRARPQQPARELRLQVSAMAVTLQPPRHWAEKPHHKGQKRPGPLRCWAVRVWDEQGSVEWMLLTSQPVEDGESALRVAGWYSNRWLIEEYHKCLKTGCRVEQRQLEAADRLQPLVGLLAVQAVRLLQLKHQAKVDPQAKASKVVPLEYIQVLCMYRKLAMALTVRQFWHEVAKLGGFLGRRGDGDPGWQTLWHGWHHLDMLVQGHRLAQSTRRRSG